MLRNTLTALALILITVPSFVRAQEECVEIFQNMFGQCPAWQCGTNVYRLLAAYAGRNIDLRRFDVVFVSGAMRSFAGLPPTPTTFDVSTRHGRLNFRAHFFLIDNATGNVYDPDFRNQPIRLDQYAKDMYGADNLGILQVKRLGAHQYFDLVNGMGAQDPRAMNPVVNHLRGRTDQWPTTTLQQVVQNFADRGLLP